MNAFASLRLRTIRTVATFVAVASLLGTLAPALADPPTDPNAPAPASGGFGTGPGNVGSQSVPDATTPATAGNFAPDATLASDRYLIRPGDVVSLNVFNQADLSEAQARVLSDGTIGIPLVGAVRISGMTPHDASLAIDRALLKFLRHPVATLSIISVAPVAVLVLGAVRAPNKYYLSPASRVDDAIAAAGGLVPIDGDLPDARLESGASTVTTVSLQKLYHGDDRTQNVLLRNGETVYVPSPTVFQVQVFGAVDHSGDVTVREGDRLSMALARAGISSNSNSDLNHVVLRRVENGTPRTDTINMYQVLASKDVSRDVVLQKNDLISVPRAKNSQTAGSAVGVIGVLSNLIRFGL